MTEGTAEEAPCSVEVSVESPGRPGRAGVKQEQPDEDLTSAPSRCAPSRSGKRRRPDGDDDDPLRWARDHYCFQVALINEVVKPPWIRCFGSLGTGFVGVRPEGPAPERPRQPAGDEGGGDGAAVVPGVPDYPGVASDATIIIFVTAPDAALQTRGGRTNGGYNDALDRSQRTLQWSGQRSDNSNKRAEAIVAHARRGGRVVVGVRPPTNKTFVLLGEVSHIDELSRARFLVEPGDHVIQERGTRTFHKTITHACLSNGLRSGVGLAAARYPLKDKVQVRWCMACCYSPPKALLHFSELLDEGVAAFNYSKVAARTARLAAQRKLKSKLEADAPGPAKKRMRCKSSPDGKKVKHEKADREVAARTARLAAKRKLKSKLEAARGASKPCRNTSAKREQADEAETPGPANKRMRCKSSPDGKKVKQEKADGEAARGASKPCRNASAKREQTDEVAAATSPPVSDQWWSDAQIVCDRQVSHGLGLAHSAVKRELLEEPSEQAAQDAEPRSQDGPEEMSQMSQDYIPYLAM